MSRTSGLTLGVIADDLTGALDTGVQFAEAGFETALVLSADDPRTRTLAGQVWVLSTDSRDGDATTAWQRAAAAAKRLSGGWLYKKIDSTMRGHVGREIEAILRAVGSLPTALIRAVVCPAVIGQGRTVREGRLWVGDRLLHESAFRHDPVWPARTSDMTALLGVPVTHLPLRVVRDGPRALAKAIWDAPTSIVTVDAVGEADVQRIAGAAVLGRYLPCGALGLARAWIERLVADGQVEPRRARSPAVPRRGGRPLLIVVGSRHPVTRAQVRRVASLRHLVVVEAAALPPADRAGRWAIVADALAGSRPVIVCSPEREVQRSGDRRALNETMARWAQRACRAFDLGGLFLTGGETALAVCRALGATQIDILGELEAGIPWGRLAGGIASGLQVVTKAGGFGRPDSLVRVVDALYFGQGSRNSQDH